MGFWNKLGKIALQAAPYVAAPFTGGASLMATGLTNQLGSKWAQHDAEKAIAKGLAPSKFDKYLGMASAGASLASGLTGGFGGKLLGSAGKVGSGIGKGANLASIASKAGTGASTASKLGGFTGQLANALGGGGGGWQGQLAGLAGQVLANRGGGGGDEEESVVPQAPRNQAITKPSSFQQRLNPIEMGRQAALQNQPWRAGYQTTISDDGNLFTNQMPAIYPQYEPPSEPQQAPQNNYGDTLTPRYARKRNPAPEQEYD